MHFALVCGAKSCPPIRVYDERNVEQGLALAAASFLEQEMEIDEKNRCVTTSMILKWYGFDFGGGDLQRLRKWAEYMQPESEKRRMLERLVSGGGRIRITYRPYDWGLND